MRKLYKNWILNASVSKKFIPFQLITALLIFVLGVSSVCCLVLINTLSQQVFTENVKNTEMLTEITEVMYVCRVLGRDILFEEDEVLRQTLYQKYVEAFDELDLKMDAFKDRLHGHKMVIFTEIIAEKEIYKESMLLSADLKNEGGKDDEALEALQVVTPIATVFFGSIDQFLTDEKLLMADVLQKNADTVMIVIVLEALICTIVAAIFFMLVDSYAKTASNSLIALEESVTEIADTGNMRINIPNELFTKDEIGSIATAIDKLKSMLLDQSFEDALTNGYNSKAYFQELSDIFSNPQYGNDKIEFWCIIFDMNNLKRINDDYGHIEGDIAIRYAHNIMVECFSKYGKIFRIGGDEFVSILPHCSDADIKMAFEKMESMMDLHDKKAEYRMSIAWGYDKFIGNTREEYSEYFKVVDKKMYEDKKAKKAL